ncbi:hypothetical protein J0695_06135 [Streptomyces beijiangensis]|uniref:PglY protein n=2 Tax=Streptomyces beijiangensis TaxID=163361 RepID=A0A939F3E5_9ACTN|nr:hypothetical protein [Streptomyces beijiangensis]
MAKGSGIVLRDVLDIREDVHSGDFKVELSAGFDGSAAGSIEQYVVTPQLQEQFSTALKLIRGALRKNTSYAAYLHGSFGAGKSHFLTVLHAVLNGDPAVQEKTRLRETVAEHADWLPGKSFLMTPYHLVGAVSLEAALLGGYVKTVRRLHPDAPTPLVYRSDSLLADARGLRASIGDEAFLRLLPAPKAPAVAPQQESDEAEDDDEDAPLTPIGIVPAQGWTTAALDAAFAAPAQDPRRDQLVRALFDGPLKSYGGSAGGDPEAFLSLDDGLSEISKHAQALGYDGVVLFLDELVLWLQAKMSNRAFINDEIQKLVKLIESSNPDRPVPIVSFISRQRDLSQLVGSDILGSDVENLQNALEYLKERFTVVDLEDSNLPDIIKERVLRPKRGQEAALEAAFAGIDKSGQLVKDVLLDGDGATGADWDDFRAVYPLSPALLNVLVALSGVLQRERTGLKLVQQLLEKNAGAEVGRLIPLGDLWDVLVTDTGAAFTKKLTQESESARRFHAKARHYLLGKYGSTDHPDFVADERFVKTVLLAALAPDVPALRRLTASRLAALNHGSVRSRTVPVRDKVVERMKALQLEFPTELRTEGKDDPVFSLHLSDLDVEPILDAVVGEDKVGVRRTWVHDQLWAQLGLAGRQGALLDERTVVWRGSERTVEFVFGTVRDRRTVADEAFEPATGGHARIILDCPFDDGHTPAEAFHRVGELSHSGRQEPVLVWLCDYFSEQRKAQLGRLMRINFLLERDRLSEYTRNFRPDDRHKARKQLEVGRETLTENLLASLREVYGLAEAKEGTLGAEVTDGRHVLSLQPEYPRPQPEGSKPFDQAVTQLADGLFAALYPQHPDFGPGPGGTPRAVTPAELKKTLEWITLATDDGGRVTITDKQQLRTVKRIVEPLELGAVHDGPLILRNDWRARITQAANLHHEHGDLLVEDIRKWITGTDQNCLGYSGLDPQVVSLLIAVYALLDDRTWVLYGTPQESAPALGDMGPGWELRAQELPSPDEYATARDQAARLFGAPAKPALFARNIRALATEVLAKAKAWEETVGGVRSTLRRHAPLLGLADGPTDPRTAQLLEAANVLARLVRHPDDPTALVRELASLSYETPAPDLSHAMDSSKAVQTALNDTDWKLLTSVRELGGRDDSVGDRAQRLLERIAEAARAPERERSLVPALDQVRERGLNLLNEALNLERPAPEPQPPVSTTDPEQITLSEHGTPPVSSESGAQNTDRGADPRTPWDPQPSTGGATPLPAPRRITGPGALKDGLTGVREEIEAFHLAHPHTPVDIYWRPVDSGPSSEDSQ